MAGTVNAGSIVYEVDIDTARLIQGRRDIDAALNGMSNGMGRLEASVDRTERSIGSMERTMSSLSGVARGLLAALSVQQVTQYAESWVTLNNKLVNALRPNEQLADVTQRVFDISQRTRSSLDATGTLYARLERATRSAGTSTADLVKLTETINKGLMVSGATTAEASSTMVQLSQALASGVLRGEEFNSISENGSRIAVALSDSLGVTIGELRAMAADGKLTTDVVVKGLLEQGDKIAKEFSKTAMTLSQSFEVATGNITKFVGESSTIQSIYGGASSAVVTLSQNLDVLSGVFASLALVMGGRFAGALAAAASAKIKSAMTSQQLAAAESRTAQAALYAANAAVRKSAADKEAAISAHALAQAEYNVARGSAAEALALDALVAANSRVIATSTVAADAQLAQAAATTAAGTAATAASAGMNLLKLSLSMLGGPAGIVMIVAAGFYYWYQQVQKAKEESISFADSLDDVISRMKEMSQIQLKSSLDKTVDSIKNQKDALNEMYRSLDDARENARNLESQLNGLKESGAPAYIVAEAQERLTEALHEVSDQAAKAENTSQKLSGTQKKLADIQAELNQKIRDSEAAFETLYENLNTRIPNANKAAIAAMALTIQTLDVLNKKSKDGGTVEPKPTKEAAQLIKNAERRLALAKLEGEARARLQAQYDAEDANITKKETIEFLKDQYAETDRVTRATKENKKESKASASAAESDAHKLQKLKEASEITADSTEQLSRAKAILNAQNSLSKRATPEMIKQAGDYAAKLWDNANALKAQAAAEKLKAEAEQAGRFSNQEKAAADIAVNPYTGKATNPAAQVELEEKQKLEAVAKYQSIGAMTEKEAQDTRTAIVKQAAYARMQIVKEEAQKQVDSMNMMLGGFQSGFEGLANIIAKGAGESSAAYRALFAVSKGFAIAQAGLNLQLAISNAMASGPFPWNLANMASVAAAGGQLVSAIGGASYAGAREHGGPVSANSMYRVGEGGKPEIFKASNGSQYMIPGDNGRVISNRDMQGGGSGVGGVVQHITFEINTTGGIDQATIKQMEGMMKRVALFQINDQANRPNGMIQPRTKR
ncbi:tape measure protein [Atlantibacter hermannii]|uniref:tape measure protein n=1 Tax=Atlantibacter hermannii TaxID=565 RepID=UPI002801BC4D|nr:tape measure protein [Atlantibacter hermannii]MDQ7883735.1 tape measure protein [Atlantibacter hermannii]